MTRLATGFWVQAYMMRLQLEGIAVYVHRRGDATAGSVMVKLSTCDGKAVAYQRRFDLMTGARVWEVSVEGDLAEVDASVEAQCGFDPDLWVIEVEDPKGRHMLDDPSLA